MNPKKGAVQNPVVVTEGPKNLEVRFSPGKGRGVFSTKAVAKNKILEECPILMIEIDSISQFDGFKMSYYIFGVDNDSKKAALLLGFGSLYNHACPSNAEAYHNTEKMTFEITAIRPIAKNEEITINYNGAFDNAGETVFLDSVEEMPG